MDGVWTTLRRDHMKNVRPIATDDLSRRAHKEENDDV